MNNKTIRNINRINHVEEGNPGHQVSPGWGMTDWAVPLTNGSAFIHHNHKAEDSHALCGPVVFCCIKSYNKFKTKFSKSAVVKHPWGKLPADQIISWMDAGMQMVYFVFCDNGQPSGINTAGLSGKRARQALRRELGIEHSHGWNALLSEIALNDNGDGSGGELNIKKSSLG